MVLTKWPYHLHCYLLKNGVFPWTTVILKRYRFTGCALVHVVILGNQFMWWPYKLHYSDVLMSGMASPFFKSLLRRRSKKASKLCGTGLCKGNPRLISLTKVQPVAGGWPSQRANIAENVSIWLVFVTGISRMVEKWNIYIYVCFLIRVRHAKGKCPLGKRPTSHNLVIHTHRPDNCLCSVVSPNGCSNWLCMRKWLNT